MTRLLRAAPLSALLLGCIAAFPALADANCTKTAETPAAAQRCTLAADDIVEVSLSEVRPTQPALGYDEVQYRLGRFKFGKDAVNKRFDDWCEVGGLGGAVSASANATLRDPSTFQCKLAIGAETRASRDGMKTAVIGPRGRVHLTDGHHTLTSFWEAEDGGPTMRVRLRVTGNLSHLSEADFWKEMAKRQWTWLRDPQNKPITPQQLPPSLGLRQFANDQARSLLYFARDIGYTERPENATFLEFYWGRWLHETGQLQPLLQGTQDHAAYLATVKKLAQAMTALSDDSVVSDGKTARQLGKLAEWNNSKPEMAGEFAKQSLPMTAAKPGKLAYVFAYRAALKP